jgi:hypothetical protein
MAALEGIYVEVLAAIGRASSQACRSGPSSFGARVCEPRRVAGSRVLRCIAGPSRRAPEGSGSVWRWAAACRRPGLTVYRADAAPASDRVGADGRPRPRSSGSLGRSARPFPCVIWQPAPVRSLERDLPGRPPGGTWSHRTPPRPVRPTGQAPGAAPGRVGHAHSSCEGRRHQLTLARLSPADQQRLSRLLGKC